MAAKTPTRSPLREQVRATHRSLMDLLENPAIFALLAPDQRETLAKGAQELYTLRVQLALDNLDNKEATNGPK